VAGSAVALLPRQPKGTHAPEANRRPEAADGAWKDKDHPELKQGSANWVRKLRQENERRFKKVTAR
jgi:hypothetical protein